MERLPRAGDGGLIFGFDAIVLAGGRASRLGGHPKPQLTYRGATLLDHALDAVDGARLTVVVGPGPGEPGGPDVPVEGRATPVTPGAVPRPSRHVLYTREVPLYAGPLAALGAGVAALGSPSGQDAVHDVGQSSGHDAEVAPDWIVVVAADLPRAPDAVAALLGRARDAATPDPVRPERSLGGVVGEDGEGRIQPLLAVYRREALTAALSQLSTDGGLADRPMRHLIARLDLLPLKLPPGVSDDVDTWDAARRWGIERPGTERVPGAAPRQEEAP
ncbi:NTP transferase domain-containing protein [Sinomonas sp. ASV486]|uniref:molybdenum cofactor guanylyltransferase n=1 Tax=Sinomonas sp. ASV486 TaxID=3051170 RepID=UPI0027DCE59A|nr:NTP transferase domain-containing protein [Sinomonas sp. ASV486]MDQ4490895.1 NTP transferase domain-containing protein [Sinomonas sp. ASV486]